MLDGTVEAGILGGDYVVMREQPVAETGDVVVPVVENEATRKHFYREGRRIHLEPGQP
jgi:repressor LexA